MTTKQLEEKILLLEERIKVLENTIPVIVPYQIPNGGGGTCPRTLYPEYIPTIC